MYIVFFLKIFIQPFILFKGELQLTLVRQNALYHNLTHKLNRILESEGSKTHIFQVFRQE
ncbi:hypothetical protein B1J93_05145 [Leptospira kirschneri serovar Pomona]|uniref:Uncharacterized protein n=1 Tax=Leptospira kirschneri serovar Pomona TaxID=561005 RepID=A0A1T1DWS8_9LEPT|nr:hypothetical protein B1J93_05145 [Leptospira kirschneri serovar Pomona]